MLARQMSDVEKRARGGFVVDTSGSLADTGRELDKIIQTLSTRSGDAYSRWQSLYEQESF
jgi:dephospho-CoA kinase